MALNGKFTAVIYSPRYLLHDTGLGHPESPMRLKAIVKELRKSGLTKRTEIKKISPRKASIGQIQSVHSEDYVSLVRKTSKMRHAILDTGDTVTSPDSYDVALLAAGGTIQASELVLSGKFKNAFALVRPPGHHAGVDYASGFCIFNNVALAASNLIRNHHLNRIAIIDIDGHHGNGTQEIFYNTKSVLYVGLHSDPTHFPWTGFIDEVGEGAGVGYNINIPLPSGTDDNLYQEALEEVALPVIYQYKPEFILVSAGFDCHYADPILDLSLTANGYKKTVQKIVTLAEGTCGGRLVMVLEGGYNLLYLSRMVAATIAQLAELDYVIEDTERKADSSVKSVGRRTLKELKAILSPYWEL